jgi:hypothetical protein
VPVTKNNSGLKGLFVTIGGKGFFLWQIQKCENGDVQKIAKLAYQAGFTHVIIKVANGTGKYNYDWDHHIDLCPDLVTALREHGIEPWGWHYVFGEDPVREARVAIERVRDLDLQGYVINAEAHYKRQQYRSEAAGRFMRDLRSGVGKAIPLALSSYRFPSMHPEIPWNQFLQGCDINMPQVYWIHSHNPGAQLEQTLREFSSPNLKAHPPVVPTGAAFTEHGWRSTASEVRDFLDAAHSLNLEAANFWEWHAARDQISERVWQTIRDFDWESDSSSTVDVAVAYVQALNSRDIDQIVGLYSNSAVHVSPTRTIKGANALRVWYQQVTSHIFPNATFTLSSYVGEGSSRHLTWIAKSSNGNNINGKDTFTLNPQGKIVYHYTFFTLS